LTKPRSGDAPNLARSDPENPKVEALNPENPKVEALNYIN
jgi:hypothetical protein